MKGQGAGAALLILAGCFVLAQLFAGDALQRLKVVS